MRLKISVVELILLGVILILAIYFVLPHFFEHEENPGADTRSKLAKLEICIILYRNKKNNWPPVDKWKEKITSFLTESESDFNEVGFFADQWGNEVHYKIRRVGEKERHVLYSYGPNGEDDDSKDDDISIAIENTRTVQ